MVHRAGAGQGDIVLAVNALLMQLFILFSYMMDGFAFAGEALAGKLTGAGDVRTKHAVVRRLFVIGGGVSIAFTVVYALFGREILGLLSTEAPVVAMAQEYLWWGVSVPLAGVTAFVWDGVFIGETRTRQMLLSMAVAMVVFFTVYLTLYPSLGNHALWLAFILYLAVRGVVQTVFYLRKN